MQKIGQYLIFILVGLLPWSVIISVFGTYQLEIGGIRFFKEILVALIIGAYLYDAWKKKVKPHFDTLDYAIIGYICVLIWVSLIENTPLKGMIYGLRYDAAFFLVLLLFRRALSLWNITFQTLAKIFLLSGGVMLIMSFLIRYVFGEMFLTLFGFSDHVSVWTEGGPPPIYHGIAGAAVVRFQGMLEGPNQMAFFLLTYIGTYLAVMARYKKYRFLNIILVALLAFLLILTYSRSGYIWFFVGSIVVIASTFFHKMKQRKQSVKKLFSLKKTLIIASIIIVAGSVLSLQFGNKFTAIFERRGSTSGHFERMYMGFLRFSKHPLGQGLASAGPASRALYDVNETPITVEPSDRDIATIVRTLKARNKDFLYNSETYYIPESWHIQQLIESGILWFFFFLSILVILLGKLRSSPYVLASLVGVLMMNIFLHSFESMHSSFALFILCAALIAHKNTSVWK